MFKNRFWLWPLIIAAPFFLTGCFNKTQAPAPVVKTGNQTMAEVAKHNNQNDCWTVISGKIYNTTSLIGRHSGGDQAILDYCGKDGTEAFDKKGQRQEPHSDQAKEILKQFYIGDLLK